MNNAVKDDKLFEALSELDDELIANAKHIDTYGEQTVVLRRTPVWKIVTGSVAAAACTALLAVGGIHAMNYVNEKAPVASDPSAPASSTFVSVSGSIAYTPAEYPEEAKYEIPSDMYDGLQYAFGVSASDGSVSLMPDFFGSYEEMAKASELIVSGEFVGYSHQTYDPCDETVIPLYNAPSYNTFYIDKVIKGDIEPGQGIAIRQNTHVYKNMTYAEWDMSPMICGDRWIYFLVMGEDGYYTPVTSKQGRYPLPFSENKKLEKVGEYGYYGYDDPDHPCDPNIDTIYADTLEAFGLRVSENFDGVELSVVLNDNTFDVDEDIRVRATVRNTTDEPIGLSMFGQGEGSYTEIPIRISHGGYKLTNIDTKIKAFNDAVGSCIVPPGEEYVQEMTFRLEDKSEQGKYSGLATLKLLSDPNDVNSATFYSFVNFSLTIGNVAPGEKNISENEVIKVYEYGSGDAEEWSMPEFPEFTFRCDGERMEALLGDKNYTLYGGMPIEEVYLVDLNGDGCREFVSTVAVGSGIVDESISAYDLTSGDLFMIGDQKYNFSLDIKDGKLIVRQYDYFNPENTESELPFSLSIMTHGMSGGNAFVFRDGAPVEFTMPETPGKTYFADKNGLVVKNEDGTEKDLIPLSENGFIYTVYLLHTDDDGIRDIVVGYTKDGMLCYSMLSADGVLSDHAGGDNGGQTEQSVTRVYEYGGKTESWTMPEFPGVSFRCDGDGVSVSVDGENGADEYGYFLYTGMPIEDVYLVDLNGDGYREIVSTAAFGSGIIDSRVYAFDYANGVHYTLCDRGNYDFMLNADTGTLNVRKYKYNDSHFGREPVSEEPLTLDMMTSDGSVYVFKGSEPAEWTMDEFPGIKFRADRSGIFAKREDGSESNIAVDSEYDLITCVYLYDNDGDGKREIIFEYINENGMHISRMISAEGSLAEYAGGDNGEQAELAEVTHFNIPAVIRGSESTFRDHSDYKNENLSYRSAYDYCNVDENAAVVSFCEGEVVAVDAEPNYNGGRGRFVAVRDDLGYYYFYSHLGAVSVNVGDKVIAGTQLGIVGNSGRWDVEENGFGVRLSTYDHMPDIAVSDEGLTE